MTAKERDRPLQAGSVVTEFTPAYDRCGDDPMNFRWSDPQDDYLVRLRAECPLLVRGLAKRDELATVAALCTWVHHLWDHSGGNEGSVDDPISIIRRARLGGSFRCVEYAAVLSACLNAFGIRARTIALKKPNVETAESEAGHVATEAYLAGWHRWVFLDGQFNFIAWLDDAPMNAVELRAALDEGRHVSNSGPVQFDFADYLKWLKPYLFYMDVQLDNRVGVADRSPHGVMLVPIGANKPKIMQRRWLIEGMTYTHSVSTFYPVLDPAAGSSFLAAPHTDAGTQASTGVAEDR